jgi:transcriptional regulator with XRE-family HTH domain
MGTTDWKSRFREEMKKQGLSLSDLAKQLQMSLSGVKKIFQKEDISLDRFRHICSILGLDPAIVLQSSTSYGLKVKNFPPEADRYLSKEPQAFHLFILLSVERIPIKDAIEELRMSNAEAYRHLRALDRLDLLHWKSGDDVIVNNPVPYLFSNDLKCVIQFCRAQSMRLIEDNYRRPRGKNTRSAIRYVQLPESKISTITDEFFQKLADLSKNYQPRGRKHAAKLGLVPVQLMFGYTRGELRFDT